MAIKESEVNRVNTEEEPLNIGKAGKRKKDNPITRERGQDCVRGESEPQLEVGRVEAVPPNNKPEIKIKNGPVERKDERDAGSAKGRIEKVLFEGTKIKEVGVKGEKDLTKPGIDDAGKKWRKYLRRNK